MKPLSWKALGGFLLAAVLTTPAWALDAARPGTLNYVEGQVHIGEETLDNGLLGSIALNPGQSLSTESGKAEILLTPGAFLRTGDGSSVQMASESPTNAAVTLAKGQATVEVAAKYKHVALTVDENGTTTRLLKDGLYEFDADHGKVLVYKGEAEVQDGSQTVRVKSGHELDLKQQGKLKTSTFDKKLFENSDLVQFSGYRSEYLAEANADAARAYYSGPGWHGPDWYWDPAYWTYTWIPGDEYDYDAFGWGFYSPAWVFDDPFCYAGFFGDFGFGTFGHDHIGHRRLPPSFSGGFARGEKDRVGEQPPAMASNFDSHHPGSHNPGAAGSGFNHQAFNRGGVGGFGGGAGGARASGTAGGFGGGHAGGFGGGHR
jgi:hypothetical protein